MYDSERKETFTVANETYKNSYWWSGEPIWITAELQNIKTAIIHWIGGDVVMKKRTPFYSIPYDSKASDADRISNIIQYLNQPFGFEPRLIMSYIESLDQLQHKEGPYSNKIPLKIKEIDTLIAMVIDEIKKKNLENFVDLMIVSDHGVTNTSRANIIYLDDLVKNFSERVHVYEWLQYNGSITVNIQPKNNTELLDIHSKLNRNENLKCHLKKDIPERFHLKNNKRVASIFCYAKLGYSLSIHDDSNFEVAGEHGYDNEEVDMRAVFIANGPSFKQNFTTQSFANVEIYNIMAKVLGIDPQLNNGTFSNVKDIFKN